VVLIGLVTLDHPGARSRGGLYHFPADSRGITASQLSLSRLSLSRKRPDFAACLGRLQREPGVIRLAEVVGADRIAASLLKESTLKRRSSVCGTGSAVGCVGPRFMGRNPRAE
jgi:hypothetical protein